MLNKAHITERKLTLKIEDSTDDIDKVTFNYSFMIIVTNTIYFNSS
jgi:hypothetical protein